MRTKDNYIVLIALTFFASTSIFYWPLEYSWHDHQRIAQLIIISIFPVITIHHGKNINYKYINTLFIIGIISCALSENFFWALKEWAKFLLLICLASYLSSLDYNKLKKIIFHISISITTLSSVAFLSFYFAALLGNHDLDPNLMYPGFDNPRFYGQFQTLLIPIIFTIIFYKETSRNINSLAQLVCITQWAILWSLAGRGSILSLLIAPLAIKIYAKKSNTELFKYYLSSLIGFFIYLFLFKIIPILIGKSIATPQIIRHDSSGRFVLWMQSIEIIKDNPIFGIGPLHFASNFNHIFAHPHQTVLQIATEWGVPFLILLIIGLFSIFFNCLKKLEKNYEIEYFYILSALAGSFILAQVDGILVMPYTEGWLAIIFGLALARLDPYIVKKNYTSYHLYLTLVISGISIIFTVLFFEAPDLQSDYSTFLEKNISYGSPARFWDIGWIPIP